ncbi:lantibiotic dehydratase [Nonomuraea solani]|nr:lantibiotic dehydratase [Nonomuraea solani]
MAAHPGDRDVPEGPDGQGVAGCWDGEGGAGSSGEGSFGGDGLSWRVPVGGGEVVVELYPWAGVRTTGLPVRLLDGLGHPDLRRLTERLLAADRRLSAERDLFERSAAPLRDAVLRLSADQRALARRCLKSVRAGAPLSGDEIRLLDALGLAERVRRWQSAVVAAGAARAAARSAHAAARLATRRVVAEAYDDDVVRHAVFLTDPDFYRAIAKRPLARRPGDGTARRSRLLTAAAHRHLRRLVASAGGPLLYARFDQESPDAPQVGEWPAVEGREGRGVRADRGRLVGPSRLDRCEGCEAHEVREVSWAAEVPIGEQWPGEAGEQRLGACDEERSSRFGEFGSRAGGEEGSSRFGGCGSRAGGEEWSCGHDERASGSDGPSAGASGERVVIGEPALSRLREALSSVLPLWCLADRLARRGDAQVLRDVLTGLAAQARQAEVIRLSGRDVAAATAALWADEGPEPGLPGPELMAVGADLSQATWLLAGLHDDGPARCDGLVGGRGGCPVLPWVGLGAHTPRIMIDDLVYQRARWRFPLPEERGADAFDRWVVFHRRCQERGLPRYVFVHHPADPRPLYMDLCDPLAVEDLARREPAEVLVTEMLPGPEAGGLWWRGVDGGAECAELRLRCRVRPAHDVNRLPETRKGGDNPG